MPLPPGALGSLVPWPPRPARPDPRSHRSTKAAISPREGAISPRETAPLHGCLLSSLFCSRGLGVPPSLPPCSWTWCDSLRDSPHSRASCVLLCFGRRDADFAVPALPLGLGSTTWPHKPRRASGWSTHAKGRITMGVGVTAPRFLGLLP